MVNCIVEKDSTYLLLKTSTNNCSVKEIGNSYKCFVKYMVEKIMAISRIIEDTTPFLDIM